MNKPLDAEVKAILEARRGEWQAIATESKVSHSWLSKFVNGHINNPGLATLRKVYAVVERRAKARV